MAGSGVNRLALSNLTKSGVAKGKALAGQIAKAMKVKK